MFEVRWQYFVAYYLDLVPLVCIDFISVKLFSLNFGFYNPLARYIATCWCDLKEMHIAFQIKSFIIFNVLRQSV